MQNHSLKKAGIQRKINTNLAEKTKSQIVEMGLQGRLTWLKRKFQAAGNASRRVVSSVVIENMEREMVQFDVVTKENARLVKITMDNDQVRLEAGAMYYMQGNLELDAQMPSVGGFLKSLVTSEKVVRPICRGTGVLYLEPSYGEFTIFDMAGEEWILDKGAYYASEIGVEVTAEVNKALAGFFSGEGFFQTKVRGSGKVVVHSQGPLERIDLTNDKLVVDGSFAVARSASLNFEVSKATKGIFSTLISGEGLVNTFTGTGSVYICPVQNMNSFLKYELGGLRSLLSAKVNK